MITYSAYKKTRFSRFRIEPSLVVFLDHALECAVKEGVLSPDDVVSGRLGRTVQLSEKAEHLLWGCLLILGIRMWPKERILSLLDEGFDPNGPFWYGAQRLYPLIEAADRGSADVVRALLSRGADPSVVDGEGKTALHHAAEKGNSKVVCVLLEHGADVDTQATDGTTPLSAAVDARNVASLRALYRGGKEFYSRDRRSLEVLERDFAMEMVALTDEFFCSHGLSDIDFFDLAYRFDDGVLLSKPDFTVMSWPTPRAAKAIEEAKLKGDAAVAELIRRETDSCLKRGDMAGCCMALAFLGVFSLGAKAEEDAELCLKALATCLHVRTDYGAHTAAQVLLFYAARFDDRKQALRWVRIVIESYARMGSDPEAYYWHDAMGGNTRDSREGLDVGVGEAVLWLLTVVEREDPELAGVLYQRIIARFTGDKPSLMLAYTQYRYACFILSFSPGSAVPLFVASYDALNVVFEAMPTDGSAALSFGPIDEEFGGEGIPSRIALLIFGAFIQENLAIAALGIGDEKLARRAYDEAELIYRKFGGDDTVEDMRRVFPRLA